METARSDSLISTKANLHYQRVAKFSACEIADQPSSLRRCAAVKPRYRFFTHLRYRNSIRFQKSKPAIGFPRVRQLTSQPANRLGQLPRLRCMNSQFRESDYSATRVAEAPTGFHASWHEHCKAATAGIAADDIFARKPRRNCWRRPARGGGVTWRSHTDSTGIGSTRNFAGRHRVVWP